MKLVKYISFLEGLFCRGESKPRKILLVCPKAPSGASWLINALICLGIRVGRSSSLEPGTFVKGEDGFYRLNYSEDNLKLHFPILTEREYFSFRDDYIVEWSHDWHNRYNNAEKIFFLVRDPRDALYSHYRRRNAKVSFLEYLHSLDYLTLVNQIDNWALYVKSWMTTPNITILRFEDFKENPEVSLRSFLGQIGISKIDKQNLNRAINSSRVENAIEKEHAYRTESDSYFGIDTSLNRKGMPYEWKSQYEKYKDEYLFISERCLEQLRLCGYEVPKEAQANGVSVNMPTDGLKYNEQMSEDTMLKLISELGTKGLILLLEFYKIFIGTDNGKYGYYESWELRIFEQNITQLIRILIRDTDDHVKLMSLDESIRFAIEQLTRQLPDKKQEALLRRQN